MITFEPLHICSCCAIVAANGDDSGCRDYYQHREHALENANGYIIVASREDAETHDSDGNAYELETVGCDTCSHESDSWGTFHLAYIWRNHETVP